MIIDEFAHKVMVNSSTLLEERWRMITNEKPWYMPQFMWRWIMRTALRYEVRKGMAERTDGLEYAKKIIEAYQSEIREAGLDKQGFCQGRIFREAITDIEKYETN